MNTLREVEPTSHMGVPRVWEKIMERIQEVAAQSGFIRKVTQLQRAMGLTTLGGGLRGTFLVSEIGRSLPVSVAERL